MVAKRTLRIVLAAPSVNAGIGEATANLKTVTYVGDKMELQFPAQ